MAARFILYNESISSNILSALLDEVLLNRIANISFDDFLFMKKANILIVEDETIVAKDLELNLQRLSYKIIAKVATGEKAIEIATTQHPDLILMDIVLRGTMDGIEATQKIQESSDIPVIYVTAYTEDSVIEKAKATHPYAYLIKPVDIIELKIAIDLALNRYLAEKKRRLDQKYLGGRALLDECLSICATCKRIRDEQEHWEQLESYISDRYKIKFSHGLCPECATRTMQEISRYRKDLED